jgi:hypothetical protein
MTPAAPAGSKPPPPKTARRPSASELTAPRRASASEPTTTPRRASPTERAAPGRRRKLPGSPRGPVVPRRVSGPLAAPGLQPRPQRADRRAPRHRTARKEALSQRLAAFLRSLPDHPLLDRLVRGRAWIPVLGVMLVGIVAMQVELLKLNANTGRSIELIGSLQSRNDLLRAQVASASDPNRIERLASRMGMTMPSPEAITFVKARSASVSRALAKIRAPNLAAFEAALRASTAASTLPILSPPPTPGPGSVNGSGQGTNAPAAGSGAQMTTTTTSSTAGAASANGAATTARTPSSAGAATPASSSTGSSTGAGTSSSTGATTGPASAGP